MIILCGIPTETPLAMVAGALSDQGAEFMVVNQRRVTENRLALRFDDGELSGVLECADVAVPLEAVTGAYLRLMDDQRLPEVTGEPAASPLRQRARAFHELLVHWAEISPATVVNRYSRMGSNSSKPYQAQLIGAAGFRVPETLVTNDPDAVLDFRARHGKLIFKSVSSERSVVKRLARADLRRLDRIRHCPVQFQEYVSGQDIRVHTVGGEVFATAIASSGVDYRYASRVDGEPPTLSAIELPDEVAERCLGLTAMLELEFAGIDLRRDPEGRFVCFEVNPSPAFSYYELHTGQPIAQAVAAHLGSQDRARTVT